MLSWWCWSHCLLWRPLGRPTHCSRPPSQASTWINDFAILPENVFSGSQQFHYSTNGLNPVWPDWVIYWTLGKFSKPLATINLPKSPTFLGNFCKGVKIYPFSSEISFGQLHTHLAIFFWSHWLNRCLKEIGHLPRTTFILQNYKITKILRAVVVAQLVERSLPMPEIRGSNFIYYQLY